MNPIRMIRLAATLAAVAGAAALQFATVTAHAHGYTDYSVPPVSDTQVQTATDADGAAN